MTVSRAVRCGWGDYDYDYARMARAHEHGQRNGAIVVRRSGGSEPGRVLAGGPCVPAGGHGGWRIPTLLSIALLCIAFLDAPSYAQDATQDATTKPEEISLDVSPKYIWTFRQNTWIPVDLLVSNDKADVSGFIEVTTYSGQTQQSPVYRIPAESPKGSRKRFRVYCHLNQTSSLSAMLYHRKRPALAGPLVVQLRPVNAGAVLCMILDDEPSDYGFVYQALQTGGPTRDYNREMFRNEELAALPDYLQCYAPFDAIIFGKVDPNNVPTRQRELLAGYVEAGGILIVCAGENAARYRGTWIEKLAGVEIGPQLTLDEQRIAKAAFQADSQTGANGTRQCVVTQLTPQAPEVKVRGRDPVLATLRPRGSGYVAVIALDAAGRGLQNCVGYLDVWRGLVDLHSWQKGLNYPAASEYVRNTIPYASGIRVSSGSSVAVYLGLYFLVGMVLNWFVWSRLKRRELAWVCLIVVSIGFTAYAFVFGTSGTASRTQLEQIEVLHVSRGGGVASLNSMVGVLSSRTSWHSFEIAQDYALASDAGIGSTGYRGPALDMTDMPFLVTQGVVHPRVTNFRVPASDLRLMRIESDTSLPGGVEGTLTVDSKGLHGTLTNNAGLKLVSPFVLFQGAKIPVAAKGTSWEVAASLDQIEARKTDQLRQGSGRYNTYGYYGYETPTGWQAQQRDQFAGLLFSPNLGGSQPDESMGPFLCGWILGQTQMDIVPDTPAKRHTAETFVVADVVIEYADENIPCWETLEVRTEQNMATPRFWGGALSDEPQAVAVLPSVPVNVDIVIPPQILLREPGEIVADLEWSADPHGTVFFLPKGASLEWLKSHSASTPVPDTQRHEDVTKTTYRLDDWREFYDPQTGFVSGVVALVGPGRGGRQGMIPGTEGRFVLKPKIRVRFQKPERGDWTSWP